MRNSQRKFASVRGLWCACPLNRAPQAKALQTWELHQQGIIRELYFRANRNEAILVLECDDMEAAQKALAILPFVEQKLIAFDLIPLKAYPGFARLFAPPTNHL